MLYKSRSLEAITLADDINAVESNATLAGLAGTGAKKNNHIKNK